ncbi:hypothetical protein AN641_00555 [Candidatus Epulonipiscioides gigas]|nr:hypothetical protein AN641_00555 [Epulopiscium sp. SCG-C07WGA-EpuloA2]
MKCNLKKIIKENIIYVVTLVICIALFYGFVSIGDINNPLIQGNLEYDFKLYAPGIRYCIYAISIAIFILISYVNTYMFREKLKEISILITLGMQRSKIAFTYSMDMLWISIMSFIIGISLGFGGSYIVNSIISYTAYNQIISNKFFYLNSFITTIIFFALMYIGLIIANITKVTFKKPLLLLNDNKIPDQKRTSKLRQLLEIILFIYCYFYVINNFKIYFSLGRDYVGDIPHYASNAFQLKVFLAIVIAVFLTIRMINYILIWAKSIDIIRFKMELFVFGRLSYRLKTITGNMFLIILVLTISLCGFALSPLLTETSKAYMEQRMVYDINIFSNYSRIENIEDIPNESYDFVQEFLKEHQIDIEMDCVLEQYFVWESDFAGPSVRKNKYDMPRLAIGISDYNNLRMMAGYEAVTLGENRFIVHISNEVDTFGVEEFEKWFQTDSIQTDSIQTDSDRLLMIADTILKPNETDYMLIGNLGDYIYNYNTLSILVLPDELCEKLVIAKTGYYANTIEKMPYGLADELNEYSKIKLKEKYLDLYNKYEPEGYGAFSLFGVSGTFRFRTIEENEILFMEIITKAVGMYVGIVCMLICMAIISIKNLMECKNSINDFYFLRQIGISKKQIMKINLKENIFFYLLPYTISLINFSIVYYTFSLRFGNRLNIYFQGNQVLNGFIVPGIVISMIFLIYIVSVQLLNYHEINKGINQLEAGI